MQERAANINEMIRAARRAKPLTQAALAEAAGCTQSAVSMFEAGRSDALSAEAVERIAGILGIEAGLAAKVAKASVSSRPPTLKFCPADECPANVPYVVQGRLIFKPAMVEGDNEVPGRCRYCGEPLQDRCSNKDCGAGVCDGSYCVACGTPYVAVIERDRGALEAWADAQRERIKEVRELSRTERPNRGGQVL